MLWWGCVLSMQGHDVFCGMQACLVYLELILIAQYIFQIPTHLHCKAVSDTTQVCDSCVHACVLVFVHAYVCMHAYSPDPHTPHCKAVSDTTQVCDSFVHACVHACVCACVPACVCVCACMCPCMHVSVDAFV